MNVSLKQLEIFVTIVECGNFTEAGKKLYLAQSTVSSHITALEEILRVSLFRRESKRSIDLTPEGKRVYQYAKDVVSKCSALEASVMEESRRELVLGASTVPAKNLLPAVLAAFAQANPACCCTVRGGNSEQIQQMVLDGDVQLGFVGSTDNRQQLTYERIAEDRLVLVTANTPSFARMREQGVLGRELLGQPMILRDRGSGTQKMIDNYFSSRNLPQPDVRLYVSDPDMLLALVAMDTGVSIVSSLAAQSYLDAGKLLAFELETTPVHRGIYMVCRKRGALSDHAKALAAMIRSQSAG